MPNSRVEMLNLSLHVQKNVLNKILILIHEVEAKKSYNFNQISASLVWRRWVPSKLEIHVVGGSEKGTQQEVPHSVIILHLQVFLLPQSLSSLVKRKSICTDVYEEREIAQRRHRKQKKGLLVKIEDGWLVAGLRAGLVCLFAWLAAVRVAEHGGKQHNEKCVFRFNSLLSFITVFQTRAQYHFLQTTGI